VYTPNGIKKETGGCSADAHCFVPVYELKEFNLKLRGPSGAKFGKFSALMEKTLKNSLFLLLMEIHVMKSTSKLKDFR
jgi:hypothetical protein